MTEKTLPTYRELLTRITRLEDELSFWIGLRESVNDDSKEEWLENDDGVKVQHILKKMNAD